MKVYFPNTAIKKSCSFFLALMMFPFFVQSQSKSVKPAVKPIKNIVKTPVVNNKIVIKTGSFSLVKTPEFIKAAAGGTILYDVIYIPFYISGNIPKKDMPVKLNIKSYSKTNPMLFVTSSGPLANDTETIQKEQFDGTTKLISIPVRVVYNGPIDMDAEAYIKIDGQDNEYYKVAFGSEVKKDNAGEKITAVAPVNTTGVAKATITLLDSVSTFTLDTIRPNTANSYQVKLFLKLSRGLAKDSVLNVSIKPVQPLQNLELPAADQKVTIQIDKDDWNDAVDTVVNKYVEVLVQQKTLAKDEQDLLIKLKGIKGKHLVKVMPFKTKSKNNAANIKVSDSVELLPSDDSEITRDYNFAVDPVDPLTVKVKLTGDYREGNNNIAFSFLDTSLSKRFQILGSPVEIKKDKWKEAFAQPAKTIQINLNLKSITPIDSVAKNTQRMDLIITGQTQERHRVKLSMPDKPFWAEIGTNFDLLDNLKTNNFYAGVYMFDKDIARLWAKKNGNNISFSGGVYESQSVSIRSTNNIFDYKDGASGVLDTTTGKVKSYKTYRDTGSISSTTSIKRIGLFISPMFRITSGKTDANGLHLFIAPYFEMLWQRISATVDYSKANKTYSITSAAGKPDSLRVASLPYKTQSFNFDFRSHYLGLAVPLYIKENDFNLYFNPMIGFSNQGFMIVSEGSTRKNFPDINSSTVGYSDILNLKSPGNGWHPFYMFQFRLNEVAYGITFSGEIRGLTISGSQPVITLAISKKFNLTGLFKPILSTYK